MLPVCRYRMWELWKNNTKQNAENQMQQFLELCSYAIRKPNFKIITQDWGKFSKNMNEEQLMIYVQIYE